MLNKSVKPIWLASYPKSGNTWVSLFLSVLLKKGELEINRMGFDDVISSRRIIDSTLGISSSTLPESDYLAFRSKMYHKWASNYPGKDYLIAKVHDACTLDKAVLFPPSITRGVVYIMRNPFDIVASLANHSSISIGASVNRICSRTHKFAGAPEKLNNQLSQHLGTWSNHIISWVDIHKDNMLIVKYEDLLNNSCAEFSKIINYLGLSFTDEEISQAVEKTSFKNVQAQENRVKFKLTPNINRFFRSGKAGGWRNEISDEQANLIIECNYESLLQYGYIDANRNVLV